MSDRNPYTNLGTAAYETKSKWSLTLNKEWRSGFWHPQYEILYSNPQSFNVLLVYKPKIYDTKIGFPKYN